MGDRDMLISQYIDNELDIEEKIEFVREVHGDNSFYKETLGMLETEKVLSTDIPVPELPEIKEKKVINLTNYASFAALAASLLVMVKVFLFAPAMPDTEAAHRFVLYRPDAKDVSLTGSFTSWQPVEMRQAGNGYWQVTLPLKSGEYSYSYIVNGSEALPDPTVQTKQDDGFGGENSVINIGDAI